MIEFRWLKKEAPRNIYNVPIAEFTKTLQVRYFIPLDPKGWGEWQDVPVVEE